MTRLESWLQQATRHLSQNSTAKVRNEIQEHYELALEAAMESGATGDEADRQAVTALGDANSANCEYRRVLLTSAEARLLREGNWEARAICSRPWLRWVFLAAILAALCAGANLFVHGSTDLAVTLLAGAMAMSLLFAAPFLPIYTPARARTFRMVRLALLLGAVVLAFGPDVLKWSWLLFSCMWPLFWIEWTRTSIRRKMPVTDWPRQLYL